MSNGRWRSVIVALGFVLAPVAVVVFLFVNVIGQQVEIPTVRRLSVLTDREIDLDFKPIHFAPYQFLIGVKGASTECPPFKGAITISGPDGKETTIPIDSGSSQESNWDPSLSEILVRIRFENPLPDGSSLWFSSMRHTPILGKEEAQQGGASDGEKPPI